MDDNCNHNTIVCLKGVGMEWERNTALREINLTVNRGDFMAITGPNGGGKTTLLRIILKLLKPSHGQVVYYNLQGEPTGSLSIGYLPQKNLIDSRFPISVKEVISSGLMGIKLPKEEKAVHIDDTVQLIGLEDKLNAPIGNLSGGQLQRTLLGRAIISRPELLVLDEPLSYVDKRFEQRIYEIVAELAKTTTILLVSHEMSTIASMANRHFIVDRSLHECNASHHAVHYDCEEH